MTLKDFWLTLGFFTNQAIRQQLNFQLPPHSTSFIFQSSFLLSLHFASSHSRLGPWRKFLFNKLNFRVSRFLNIYLLRLIALLLRLAATAPLPTIAVSWLIIACKLQINLLAFKLVTRKRVLVTNANSIENVIIELLAVSNALKFNRFGDPKMQDFNAVMSFLCRYCLQTPIC